MLGKNHASASLQTVAEANTVIWNLLIANITNNIQIFSKTNYLESEGQIKVNLLSL